MVDISYDQLLVSSMNNNEKKLDADSYTYQSIFLSSIIPDSTNARFLPAILIEDEDANLFTKRSLSKGQLLKMYDAEGHVLIGKSCIINCLHYGSANWKKANHTIESILELGNNISVSELIQAPTVYPISQSKFQILTGHRRFFALVYANGYGSAAQFKLYKTKPLLTKVKQFQENASREDLPQYGKLTAFVSAMSEVDSLNKARIRIGLKKLTVRETASTLGISMGAFDNYNVLTRYTSVLNLYESGLIHPFVKTKKVILEVESRYKKENNKSVLNVTDKKSISSEVVAKLVGQKRAPADNKAFKIKPIQSASTIKSLLTRNILDLDIGIDWQTIDWDDHAEVSQTISQVIEFLENENSKK